MAGQVGKRQSSTAGCDYSDHDRRRTLTLIELRPLTLIGLSMSLFPWMTRYEHNIGKFKKKGVRKFYENQNEVIESLVEVDRLLDSGIQASLIEEYGDDIGQETPPQRQAVPQSLWGSERARQETNDEIDSPGPDTSRDLEALTDQELSSRVVRFWINLNMAANILLLLGKIAVYLMTDSLSIGASLVDSILDLMSTVIIFVSATFADRRDWKTKHLYPVGRNRLEPIGILVFSVMMIVSFFRIAQEALTSLLTDPKHLPIIHLGPSSLVVMIGTLVVKGTLWELCRRVPSSSVRTLAQDALTDCIFNFFSILFPLLSQYFHSGMLDPLGALFLSLYVVHSWGATAMEHINNLTGAACSPLERQHLLYLCIRFSERIQYITALNAYHAGDRLMCEVDVLLDPALTMRDAHDLAESLQYALETVPFVERAFVHIEYRRGNFSGHVE